MSAQAVTMPKAVRVIPAKPEYSGKSNSDFRPKRVAAYCRVSTDKEEQEHSFETQKEMYTDMIMMKPNWQMAGIYADVYNQRLIPFDTKKTVQTLKITAFEGKTTCRKPLFLLFETMMPNCRVHQCTQQIRSGCICTQAK